MNFSKEFRHDFSNNIIKIDIIGKLIAEELSFDKVPEQQLLEDFQLVLTELEQMQIKMKKTIS